MTDQNYFKYRTAVCPSENLASSNQQDIIKMLIMNMIHHIPKCNQKKKKKIVNATFLDLEEIFA